MRRYRKLLSSTVLGLWAFAMFVGIANACSWTGARAVSYHPTLTLAAHAVHDAAADSAVPGCDEFCSNDAPLAGVVKTVPDQPTGHPVVLSPYRYLRVLPISAPVFRVARTAHPPPGVPFSLRIVRLTL